MLDEDFKDIVALWSEDTTHATMRLRDRYHWIYPRTMPSPKSFQPLLAENPQLERLEILFCCATRSGFKDTTILDLSAGLRGHNLSCLRLELPFKGCFDIVPLIYSISFGLTKIDTLSLAIYDITKESQKELTRLVNGSSCTLTHLTINLRTATALSVELSQMGLDRCKNLGIQLLQELPKARALQSFDLRIGDQDKAMYSKASFEVLGCLASILPNMQLRVLSVDTTHDGGYYRPYDKVDQSAKELVKKKLLAGMKANKSLHTVIVSGPHQEHHYYSKKQSTFEIQMGAFCERNIAVQEAVKVAEALEWGSLGLAALPLAWKSTSRVCNKVPYHPTLSQSLQATLLFKSLATRPASSTMQNIAKHCTKEASQKGLWVQVPRKQKGRSNKRKDENGYK